MTIVERTAHSAKRLVQTPRAFANWPGVLRELAGIGHAESVHFVTRDGVRMTCPNLPGARLPLYEQFADDCYDRSWVLGRERPLGVLDIGSHVGAFAINLASAGTHVWVECYEPSATSARYLRDNVAANGLGSRVRAHQQAVAATAGVALFDDNQSGSVHNGLVTDGTRLVAGEDAWGDRGTVEVETTTFDAAVAAAPVPVTVVKLDCEGGEYDLVSASSPKSWESVQRVVMEYHPVPGRTWPELRSWLADVGLHVERQLPSTRCGLGTAWLSRRSPGGR